MTTQTYFLRLAPDEERIAQILTRDAWTYFNNLISQREIFHVKEIPMMPRRGSFELTNDAEIIQYYLDNAFNYTEELMLLGWEPSQANEAATRLVAKLESATGMVRGMVLESAKTAG
jgi:hypothetical protein